MTVDATFMTHVNPSLQQHINQFKFEALASFHESSTVKKTFISRFCSIKLTRKVTKKLDLGIKKVNSTQGDRKKTEHNV